MRKSTDQGKSAMRSVAASVLPVIAALIGLAFVRR
jgi:hypothetical protein